MGKAQPIHEEIVGPISERNPRNSEAAIVELKDDRLLLAWSEFYGGADDFAGARIAGRLSSDGGRTWGARFIVVENTSRMNTFNPSFLRLSSGALSLFYFHQEALDNVKQHMRQSFDEGQTWTEAVCITPDPVRQFMVNDRAVRLSSGRIVLPISWAPTWSDVPPNASFRSLCWYSDDDGGTWHRGRGEVCLPKRGAMEPVVVERRDSTLLMVIRTQLGHQYRSESYDDGETWTEAKPIVDIIGSEAPANVKRIPGTGDLLIVWNRVFDPLRSAFGRTPLTAAISHDDGGSWAKFRNLETEANHSYAYPSVLFRANEVLLTYYRSRGVTKGWELKLTILPLDWFYEEDGCAQNLSGVRERWETGPG